MRTIDLNTAQQIIQQSKHVQTFKECGQTAVIGFDYFGRQFLMVSPDWEHGVGYLDDLAPDRNNDD